MTSYGNTLMFSLSNGPDRLFHDAGRQNRWL